MAAVLITAIFIHKYLIFLTFTDLDLEGLLICVATVTSVKHIPAIRMY